MNIKKMLLLFALLFLGIFSSFQVGAQGCITFVGTATPNTYNVCGGFAGFLNTPLTTNSVLDTNEVIRAVLHTGSGTTLGTIVQWSSNTNQFNGLPSSGVYSIAAVAGNRQGNRVNLNDPCLSVADLGTVTIQSTPVVSINPPSILNCTDVTLTATVTPPSGSYTYNWAGPGIVNNTNLTATVNFPGFYTLIVTDPATGCAGIDTVSVVSSGGGSVFIFEEPSSSCGTVPENLILQCSIPPSLGSVSSYEWSTGATTSTINVPNAVNTYCVTITLVNGCVYSSCRTTVFAPQFTAEIIVPDFGCDSLGQGGGFIYVASSGGLNGGVGQFSYLWNNGSTLPYVNDVEPGTYTVTVTDGAGCSVVTSYFIESLATCGVIKGHVWGDMNSNCTLETTDLPLNSMLVEIRNLSDNTTFLMSSRSDGSWFKDLETGNYRVTLLTPNPLLWTPCVVSQDVFVGDNDTIDLDLFLQPEELCSRLNVDITAPILRRCFQGFYNVRYCNTGTTTAANAYIDVTLDPFLTYFASTIPGTEISPNVWRFPVGDVELGTCGNFEISVSVSCNATLGQTHCTEAVIFPHEPCGEQLAQWSGASVQIIGTCDGDSLRFQIKNVGTNVMSVPLEYVVIEDAVMLMSAPPPTIVLNVNDVVPISVPANGATWRVQSNQEPNHPGMSMPALSIEGCAVPGTVFSTGFVNQYPPDDADYWKDIDCTENRGAYDPNDKQGFPIGYGSANNIRRGTDIEYLIRFQNTGTDTAFTVIIRDTLSAALDPKSLVLGASSHPYRFDFFGEGNRQIKFTFENILLPDSTTNFEQSQGFVSFRISQQPNLPLKTVIYNQAAIFFDFNEPIYTNTTRHTVDENFMIVSSWEPAVKGAALLISPNPMQDVCWLELTGVAVRNALQIEVMDMQGRTVYTDKQSQSRFKLERGTLPAGMYAVRMIADGTAIGTGKIVVE